MPANNTDGLVHWLAGKAPNSIGHLYTPNRTERPKSWLPYALDNGAFSAAINKRDFDYDLWQKALDRYCCHAQPPIWLVVPDAPFFAAETTFRWIKYAETYRRNYHVPIALAVQDGMDVGTIESLSVKPDLIFVGGTTDWKWATVRDWCKAFPRVHVARVNGRRALDICQAAGAESCDGSGWFRGDLAQILELVGFIAEHHGLDPKECAEAARSSRHLRDQQGVLQLS